MWVRILPTKPIWGTMFRKEMIEKIENILNNLQSVKCSNKLRAETILTSIEKEGMVPPPTILAKHTNGQTYRSVVNAWDEVLEEERKYDSV